jgi:inorganic pyrophosphatase
MDPYHVEYKVERFPEKVLVYIEVEKNTRVKYEYCEELKSLLLDRILHSAVFYPHNYGFIPRTLCGDGDPLDILVMTTEPLKPGTFCIARPICHLIMEDEKGMDEKVLAVCDNDAHFCNIQSVDDLNNHVIDELTAFFETYKKLEKKKWVKIKDWSSRDETYELILNTQRKYIESKVHEIV